MKRLSLFDSAKSRRSTRISGDMFVILIASFDSALLPALSFLIGRKTNGSDLVPFPDMNAGVEVVFSGSGPISATLSPMSNGMRRSSTSNRMTSGRHHSNTPAPSSLSSSAYLPSIQFPSSSTSGTLVWFNGSLPHLSSISSRCPSLSSSGSVSRPVTDSSSGIRSPSKSLRTPKPRVKLMFTRPLSAVIV